MADFLAVAGFLGFFAGCFLLVYNLLKKQNKKTAAFIIFFSLLAFVVGAALSDPPGNETGTTAQPMAPQTEEGTRHTETGADPPESSKEPAPAASEANGTYQNPQNKEAVNLPIPAGRLQVHFIDVGQGDAIFVQTEQQNVLIDAGERGKTVVNYLKNLGVAEIDLVIGTHPHADHIGGLIDVLQAFPVKEVIDPGVVHTTKTFEAYLTLIDEKNIKFTEGRAGLSRTLAPNINLEILHPTSPSGDNLNNASLVTRIICGQIAFLFTGDIESDAEKEILGRKGSLSSTVLKIAHHGSRTSTSTAFLNAVSPEVAVIMAGSGNTYGHPHAEILQRLTEAQVKIYRTDLHGTIVITTDGQDYKINIKEPYRYVSPKEPEKQVSTAKPAPAPETQPTKETKPAPNHEQAPKAEPAPKLYLGSIKSDKYHKPTCRHAKKILPENEIWFTSIQDAKTQGYVPCGVCKP
ncbi:MAG: MBL fold metallo-hydrolase [Firmicutes bacterium]|nr:MBL fold metallo-hydrolase [Bacillota bacterium]